MTSPSSWVCALSRYGGLEQLAVSGHCREHRTELLGWFSERTGFGERKLGPPSWKSQPNSRFLIISEHREVRKLQVVCFMSKLRIRNCEDSLKPKIVHWIRLRVLSQ